MARWHPSLRYAITVPERCVRALFAGLGGTVHETAQILLPRVVRRSRLYEATAKNGLRIAIEVLGGVSDVPRAPDEPEVEGANRIAAKKAAGNVVEFGSVAAFGFSPLWLLAAAADVLNGSRAYLRTLEHELAAAGLIGEDVHFSSVDQLIGALEGTAGNTARMIDLPPIEIAELRRSVAELKSDATSLPSPAEMAALFNALVRTARTENRSMLEVSSGVGLAFLTSARNAGRDYLVAPYREDWTPLRTEGFGAYAARIGRPYRRAVAGHFRRDRPTLTERLPDFGRRGLAWVAARYPRRKARPRD